MLYNFSLIYFVILSLSKTIVTVMVQATYFFLHIAVDDLTMANARCTAFRLI